MVRDYNFWIYIITNRNHSVFYIGVTNRLSRRTWQPREGVKPGFASKYQCKKLVYYEHYPARSCCHRSRIAVEEMVGSEENRPHQSVEPKLE